MLLFVSLKYIIGFEAVRNMSSFEYWAVIFCLIPPLVLISAMTYRLIEFPAMQQVPRVMRLLRIRPVKEAGESLEDLSVVSTNTPQ
jgi:peptidoglycan/LPS O-acetylase OafA/YrhL